jgi:methionine-rich copper-binding protein CopC
MLQRNILLSPNLKIEAECFSEVLIPTRLCHNSIKSQYDSNGKTADAVVTDFNLAFDENKKTPQVR